MERRSHRYFLVSQLLILAIFSGVLLWHVFRLRPEERALYQELVHPVTQSGVPIEYQSRQYRRDICRDIFSDKLQTRLIADQGVMVFIQDTKMPGFVEELKHVECWIQEDIEETPAGPIQTVRHIMAEHACFDYRTNTLTTEAISFERYVLPDRKLNFTVGVPMMTGQASSGVVTFTEGKPNFEAKRLKIQLPGKIS